MRAFFSILVRRLSKPFKNALSLASGFCGRNESGSNNNKLAVKIVLSGLLLSFFIINSVIGIPTAQAAVGINQQVNFQGKLVNTNGTNIPDGTYNVELKLYTNGTGASTGGGAGASLVFTEDHLVNNSTALTITNGIFQVNLGAQSGNPLPTNIWNIDTIWLSINLGNTTNCSATNVFGNCAPDGEMLPMIRFTATPYALNSGQLGGLTSSQYAQLAQGVQIDASTTNSSLFINKTGTTANILQLQRGGADVEVIANDGSTLFKNQTDSATGFRIQSASAAQTLLTADTTNNKIKIGDSTGTDTATTLLQVDSATADPTAGLATRNGGLFYNSTTDQLKVIEAGAAARVCTTTAVCAGYAPSAGNGYVQLAPASVQADATTNSSIFINKTGASGNLVQLQNGGVDKFSVTNNGTVNAAGGAVIGASTASAKLSVQPGASSSVAFAVQAFAGQTADLARFNDVNNATLSKFDANGALTTYGTSNTFAGLATPAFTTASSGSTYYYVITATNAAGETVASASLGMANNTSALAWTQVNGATGYKIYRNTSNAFTSGSLLLATITNGTTVGFTDSGAATGAGLPPTTPSGTKLVVQAWGGQPSNILEAQSSNGTPVAYIDSTGTFRETSNGYGFHFNDAGSLAGRLSIYSDTVNTIGGIFRGAVSQSADLLQLQDNGGLVNSKFNGLGNQLTLGRIAASGTVTQGSLLFADGTTDNFSATLQANTQTANTIFQLPAAAAGTYQVCTTASVCSGYGTATGSFVNLAPNSVQADATTNSSIFINKTGASGNLLQLQKGGVDKLVVDNSGNVGIGTTTFGTNNKFLINPYNTVDNLATAQINTTVATNKGLVIQGFTGQSADLFQLQNTAGTVLSKIDASGDFVFGSPAALATPIQVEKAGTNVELVRLTQNNAGTVSGLRIYDDTGAGGGTHIARVGAAGNLAVGEGYTSVNIGDAASTSAIVTGTYLELSPAGGLGASKASTILRFHSTDASSVDTTTDIRRLTSGQIVVNPAAGTLATTNLFGIRASATQSGDLLQLQNNIGNVLSKFDASGNLSVGTATSPTGGVATFNGNVGIGTTAATGLLQVTQATTGTGTVATAASTSLTGTNTQFLNTFKIGDTITVSGETVRTISAIASNTSLTVSVAFSTTASSLSYTLTGGDRLTVLGNGNVGIGIANPGAALDVSGDIRLQGLNRNLYFNNGSVQTSIGQMAGSTPGLYTSGYFGVGLINPSAQLQVLGTSGISGGTGTAGTAGLTVVAGNGGNSSTAATAGGAGGAISLTSGAGGNSTGVAGTNGANISLQGGAGGTGSTAGSYGNVVLNATGGNVGIGTASPSAPLNVNQGSSLSGITLDSPSSNIQGAKITLNDNIGAGTYTALVQLDNSGNLVLRQSQGSIYADYFTNFYIRNSSFVSTLTANSSTLSIGRASTPTASTLQVYDATATTGATQLLVQGGAVAADAAANQLFRVNQGGGTTGLFVVQGNGNVGIGTTGPSAQLHVVGTAGVSGGTGTAGTAGLTVVAGNGGNSSTAATAGGAGGAISLTSGAGGNSTGVAGTNGANISLQGGAGGTGSTAGSYGNIVLNAGGGNVGIGTSAPTQGKLVISGNTVLTGDSRFIVANDNGAVRPFQVTNAAQSVEYFGVNATNTLAKIFSNTTNGFDIGTGSSGTTRISIDATGNISANGGQLYVQQSNGNVGIGTTAPSALLSVGGTTGNLTVNTAGDLATVGNLTIATGKTLTNASSTLLTAVAIANLATGGPIGTAAATVDVATTFTINQTTAAQTLTVPSPTVTTAGRLIYISNIGSVNFTMLGATISTGTTATLIWNGTAWTFAGADASSVLNQNTSNQSANFKITGTGQANTSLLTPLVDVASASTLGLGTGTATAITLGKAGVTTTNAGALTVTGAATINGGLTVATGNTLTNASSTLLTAVAISDLPTGGNIGTAVATVDVATTFTVNQTTANQTLTIPSPTVTTAGRLIYISNIGTVNFTLLGATISTGTTATLIWNGTAWTFAGADASSILNQNSTNQTANYRITGTGQANTSLLTPLVDVASAGTLALGTGTATAITIGKAGVTTTALGPLTVSADSSSAFLAKTVAGTNIFNVDTTSGILTSNQGSLALNGVASVATPTLVLFTSGGNLGANITLAYRVAAINTAGVSTEAIATSPTSVTTGNGTSNNQTTITWASVTGAANYKVYRTINGGANWFVNTFSAGTTTITDNGTTYTWATAGTPATSSAAGGVVLGAGGGVTFNANNGGSTILQASASATTSYVLRLPSAQGGVGTILQNDGSGNLSWIGGSGCSSCVAQVPATTAQNTISPTAASVVALTVKGTTGTAANVLEIYNSNATPTRQAFFDSSGSLNVAQPIQPTTNNAVDLGLAATGFRSGYFATSVLAPLVQTADAATASTALVVRSGNTTAGTSLSTGGVTIKSGDGSGTTTNSGAVSIDAGTATGTTGGVSIGTTNASSLTLGKLGAGTTTQGNLNIGTTAGSGTTFTNNGSTVNSVLGTLGDFATGGPIGTAANTVDKYTYIAVPQTTASQTLTIPTPTANTTYGRIIYLTNTGTASFTLLGSTLNAGATATLVWANVSPTPVWTYAGADGTSILNQNTSNQTANFRISGTGQANISLLTPTLDTATAVALNIGTTTASSVTLGRATSTTGLTLQGSSTSTFTGTNATGTTALGFAAPTTVGTVTYQLPAGGTGGNTYGVCTTFAVCTGYAPSTAGAYVQQVPGSTAQNTIAPTAPSVVALTVKGTTGTAANVLELFDSTASPVRQAFFDNTGALTLSKQLTVSGALTSLTGATTGDALNVSNSTSAGNIAVFKSNATAVATIASTGNVTLAPVASTSGSPSLLTLTAPAHTGLANAEAIDANLNLARTVTFTGGASTSFATQRALVVAAPTYAATTGTLTIADAATQAITGAPSQGANVAITNSHGLLIQAGASNNATNAYGLTVNAPTGSATNKYAAAFLGGNVGIGTAAPTTLLHVKQTAAAATGETIARFDVSDDSTANLSIKNNSNTNAEFLPAVVGTGSTAQTALLLQGIGTTDTGTTPITILDSRLSGAATVANRPIFDLRNNGSSKLLVDASGNIGIGIIGPSATLHVVSPNQPTAATAAGQVLQVTGGSGGTAGASQTGGLGATANITAGAGGAATAATGIPGAGGTIALVGGAGGAGTSTSTNGSGGNISLQAGAPGVGGSGTAGSYGNITLQSAGGNVGIGTAAPVATFDARGSAQFRAVTDSTTGFMVQNSLGASSLTVDTTNTATSLNLGLNSGGEVGGTPPTSWAAHGAATVTQEISAANISSGSGSIKAATTGASQGARNNVGTAMAASTNYVVSFSIKTSVALTNANVVVRFSPDGTASNNADCSTYTATYNPSISTSSFIKYTCTLTTAATATTGSAYLAIFQGPSDSTARNIWIDNLNIVVANATGTQNTGSLRVGGPNSQGLTLLTLDTSAGTPFTGTNTALVGSMYFDTTSGKIQCYDGSVWGACGAAPNGIITLTPEYAGATLHGTVNAPDNNIGTLTSDFCATSAALTVGTLCGSGDARNFYKWTTTQPSQQTFGLYVTYKLPPTFKNFLTNTITLTGRTDSAANGFVTYEVFKSTGSAITACGTATDVTASSVNTWTKTALNTDPSGCGFLAGQNVIFKINVKSVSSANVYVENLNFTFSNQ